jgi:arabinose-5-phosphate isomerase
MLYSERAKQIFQEEVLQLNKLAENIDGNFDSVVDAIFQCDGKVVVTGVGKTGTIGQKIASSLASTGTPAIFINAAEAMHGDLGMVLKNDIVLLISNSGSSQEILNIIAPLKRIGAKLIAMTGNEQSALARESDFFINTHIEKEACPLGLAPTTSTTAALVMGDALMICLMEKRNFHAENYALYHPGGALGRKLLCRVQDVMSINIPVVSLKTPFRDVIYEVSNKRLGMTIVQDESSDCCGIITDGDIRRAVQKYDDLKNLKAEDFMSVQYKKTSSKALLTEALEIMDNNNITTLAVEDQEKQVCGIISIHHIIDFQ